MKRQSGAIPRSRHLTDRKIMSAPARAGTRTSGPSLRKLVFASFFGTALEWYDFFIYATAAALVFPAVFFPTSSETTSLLAAFATFGAGFVARPLGGAVFGHFGDRVGRKAMLVFSLVGMGVATTLIGVLPTYEQIGVAAPILLVLIRLVQGFSVGGESSGAILIGIEHGPQSKKGLFGSFSQAGLPVGTLLSAVVFLVMNKITTPEQFNSWGWRVPFLISAALIVVGLIIRRSIDESPAFEEIKAQRMDTRAPFVVLIRTKWRVLALAIGSFMAPQILGYVAVSYGLSYGTKTLGYSRETMLALQVLASVSAFIVIPASAALSDRIGRLRVILGALGICLLASLAFFPLLEAGTFLSLSAAYVFMLAATGATSGPQAALFSELFDTSIRYSGLSFVVNIGSILGGGFAPFIATALYAAYGGSIPITLYMVAATIVSLVSVGVLAIWFRPSSDVEGEKGHLHSRNTSVAT
ncbi:MFS transporter [Rhodococcus sp. T2V]|uniref:MFS transporter n=1 Tax=Rhodococcus sp. T2V TaxID=3034164 RepID=UPI0023E24B23|nr:MFS transporter [Rhodococcus sp. T2V]MDF3313170.1 MFS transporter [Rhodococcus sp. T2V]